MHSQVSDSAAVGGAPVSAFSGTLAPPRLRVILGSSQHEGETLPAQRTARRGLLYSHAFLTRD